MTDENRSSSRILLAHKTAGDRSVLQSILEEALHHEVIASVGRGEALVQKFIEDVPDLVVSSIYLEDDDDAIEYLIKAAELEPRPRGIVKSCVLEFC